MNGNVWDNWSELKKVLITFHRGWNNVFHIICMMCQVLDKVIWVFKVQV